MFFSCLAKLEHEMSLLYEAMVEKTEDLAVKPLLIFLLEDTRKHRMICEHISKVKSEPYPVRIDECEKEVGTEFKRSIDYTRSLRDKFQKGMPLLDVVMKLVEYDEFIGEEYLTLLYSRMRFILTKENEIQKILEYIADDEERHKEILELVIGSAR